MHASSASPRPPARGPYTFLWLVPGAFLAHCAEELPSFPAWATRHFGTTTTRFYVASHVLLLIPATVAVTARGVRDRPGGPWLAGAAAVAAGFFANGLFHLATTALFRRRSPGVLTAVAVVMPATAGVLARIRREGLLSDEQLVGAALAGNALTTAAVASLYVDMPRLGG